MDPAALAAQDDAGPNTPGEGGATDALARPMVQTMLTTLPEELRMLGPAANGLLQVSPMVPAFRAMTTVINLIQDDSRNKHLFGQLLATVVRLKVHFLALVQKGDESWRRSEEEMIQVATTLRKAETLITRYTSSWWISKFLCSAQFAQEVHAVTLSLALHLSSMAARAIVDAAPAAVQVIDMVEEFVRIIEAQDPGTRDRRSLQQRIRELREGRGVSREDTIQAKAKAGDFAAVERMLLADPSLITQTGRCFGLLHQAIFWENIWAVAMLINFRVNLNVQTIASCFELPEIPQGSTALHIAVTIGNAELVRLLLCREEVDLSIKNENGKTALELAIDFQFAGIADDLQRAADFVEIRRRLQVMAKQGSPSTAPADRTDLTTTLSLLMDHKVPLDTRLGADFSIIHYAAWYGNDTVYRLATACGASPLLRSQAQPWLPSEIVEKRCVLVDQEQKRRVLELMQRSEEAARAGAARGA